MTGRDVRYAWAAAALFTLLIAPPRLHALAAAPPAFVPFASPPPPPLTQPQVDALITKLGDNSFAVRQQAQTDLEAAAALSSANAYLIVARIKALGLPSADPEVRNRSDKILTNLIPLGALSITIDDRYKTFKATSDGNNRDTKLMIQPPPPEEVRITDPFFDQFVGATKTVAVIDANAKKNGNLTPVSDVIFFEAILGGGGNRVVFTSYDDDPNGAFVDCTNPAVACVHETGAFQDLAPSLFGNKVGFAKILVASEEPEPATILLAAPGIAAVLYAARRRKKQGDRQS